MAHHLARYRSRDTLMTHQLDEDGQPIHVDIDPFIPTGVCAICSSTPQETQPPEDRTTPVDPDPPQEGETP